MNNNQRKLELTISYILIAGVLISIILELSGIILYYYQNNNINLNFSPEWQLSGSDFISFSVNSFQSLITNPSPIHLMVIGIVALMFTPYIRVIASLVYFGILRNLKYTLLTLIVFVILTLTLTLH